jgi:hypothetical protein
MCNKTKSMSVRNPNTNINMRIPTVNRCENIECDSSDQCEQDTVCSNINAICLK